MRNASEAENQLRLDLQSALKYFIIFKDRKLKINYFAFVKPVQKRNILNGSKTSGAMDTNIVYCS